MTLLLFRRANPDELLLVLLEAKRALNWTIPFTEVEENETAQDAARQLAESLTGRSSSDPLDLGSPAVYRVKDGPNAGEWTQRFLAVEVPIGTRAREGRWLPHYDAKAAADASKLKEAISRLREIARLKP